MIRKKREGPQPLIELFKPGIIVLVTMTGLFGYFLSFEIGQSVDFKHLLLFLIGLIAISAGSFALNQFQEAHIDIKMQRTMNRPIPAGVVTAKNALIFGVLLILIGSASLWAVSALTAILGLVTALMYNVLYTLHWKRHWAFGAVPGAIPGAMPVIIGYSANSSQIFETESIYLFMLMFLWQMPHFWSLAIKFQDDYRRGGIPVLPTVVGVKKTLYHMGLYVFVYVGLAIAAPWFVSAHYLYAFVTIPFALKVLWEFWIYYRASGDAGWLRFFMWINVSLLIFMSVPVIERWSIYFLKL